MLVKKRIYLSDPQNFNRKLKRGTVSFEEMLAIEKALDVRYEQTFFVTTILALRRNISSISFLSKIAKSILLSPFKILSMLAIRRSIRVVEWYGGKGAYQAASARPLGRDVAESYGRRIEAGIEKHAAGI